MATASKKKSKSSKKKKNIDEDVQCQQAIDRFEISNIHGIKTRPIWKLSNRYDYTYFILPPPPPIYVEGKLDFEIDDFIKFWHELDDLHKERRLLADYMSAILMKNDEPLSEFIQQMLSIKATDDFRNGFFQECVPFNVCSVFREVFIGDQRKRGKGGFRGMVMNFHRALFEDNLIDNENTIKCNERFFQDDVNQMILNYQRIHRIVRGEETAHGVNFCLASIQIARLWKMAFKAFLTMYSIWKSIDEINQKGYLKKLKVSVPHWRKEDRSNILRILNGDECLGKLEFLKFQLLKVGLERLKVIAFGKEKFCANYNRSSYVGEDRLWTCKRCEKEHIRPKARYCNTECQRAHWLKHKAEIHSWP